MLMNFDDRSSISCSLYCLFCWISVSLPLKRILRSLDPSNSYITAILDILRRSIRTSLSLFPLNFYYSPLLLQPFENSSCARLVITVKTPIGMFSFVIPRPLHIVEARFPESVFQHNLELITRTRGKEEGKKTRLPSSLYVAQRWQFKWNNVGLSGH